jgi:hypothetical protein
LRNYRLIISAALLVLTLSLVFIPSTDAFAGQDITITDISTQVTFPASIVFKVSAGSQSEITSISLSYKVDRLNYAPIVTEVWASFNPGDKISARWDWDMRQSNLPPDAAIEYWWTLKNKDNTMLVSPRYNIKFSDDHYSWKNRASGNIMLHWYEGDDAFASDLISTAAQALQRLSGDAGVQLDRMINIYIYDGSDDFQKSLVDAREWTGGVAVAEFNCIVIGIAPSEIEWGRGALAHELGHLVVREIAYSPYSENMATWLSEGLAMHAEAGNNRLMQLSLKKALDSKQLISLRSLASPFSANSDRAYLSYAESQSVVDYLINSYGNAEMIRLLKRLQSGATIDEALTLIYGFDQDSLETRWIESLAAPKTSMLDRESRGGAAN